MCVVGGGREGVGGGGVGMVCVNVREIQFF